MRKRLRALRMSKKHGHKIVEFFFDGDRNDPSHTSRDARWRILIWDSSENADDIDPDAKFVDAHPGKMFTYTEGMIEARKVFNQLSDDHYVSFAKVIAAKHIVDRGSLKGGNESKRKQQHRYSGPEKENLCQRNDDSNLGASENSEEQDTMQ